jgi:hypothetical protein
VGSSTSTRGPAVRGEAREDGQRKGRGLAGARLRGADQVAAGEHDGNGAELDGSRIGVTGGLDAAENGLGELRALKGMTDLVCQTERSEESKGHSLQSGRTNPGCADSSPLSPDKRRRLRAPCEHKKRKRDGAPKELRPSKIQFVETSLSNDARRDRDRHRRPPPPNRRAAAAAEAATTAAAAEAATRALFLRTGFIDGQLTAAEIGAVHLFRGGLGLIGRAHGDERETAGAAGHLVHGDVNVGHGAELAESRAELVFGGLERQVTDV